MNTHNIYLYGEIRTRVVRKQHSSPERGDPIWKQSLNIKDEMQNLNLISKGIPFQRQSFLTFIKHSCKWQSMTLISEECPTEGWGICHWNVFPYVGRDQMKAIYYMLIPLDWCGWNMKAISYILQQSNNFQNLNTAVNDKVWPNLDLCRKSNWGRGVCCWKVLP